MSELGQWLREARQARGLSLEKAEVETRIRLKFLSALEEGNYEELPAEVYARGFVRNYALYLGLDPIEALEKYEKRDADSQSGEPGLFRPLEVVLFQAAKSRLWSRLLVLILVCGLFTVALWAWRTGRLAWPPSLTMFRPTATLTATSSPGQTPATTLKTLTTEVQATATTRPATTPTLSPTPRATPTLVASPTEPLTTTVAPTTATVALPLPISSPTLTVGIGVTVQISVTDQCWVEVTRDGLDDFRGMLDAGDERTWQAQRGIVLRLGNAGGVQVTVNGEFLGALGERQQVVEFAWGPEGEITPAPTVTATTEGVFEAQETPTP